jgi:drug/metabolite transporter (DMT)-like permease
MSVPVALAIAILSTILLDLSYLFQQRSEDELPNFSPRHPALAARSLLGAKLWALGAGLGILGWLASLVIALADLSLVQAASASGIAILAVIAVLWFGQRLSRRERLGVALATVGLIAIGLSLGGTQESTAAASEAGVIVWVVASAAIGLGLSSTHRMKLLSSAAAAGLAAGVMLRAGRVSTKGLLDTVPDDARFADYLASPFLYITIVIYALGVWAQAVAFQRGQAVNAISLLVASTSIVPILAGLFVFNDPLPGDALGLTLRLAGFALVLGGAALLAVRVMMGSEESVPASPARVFARAEPERA